MPPEITQLLREVGDGPPDMWKSKPVWCQPWTILLTGSAVVYAPTLVFHAKWASALVAVPIVAWWYLFLLVVPKQYADYVAWQFTKDIPIWENKRYRATPLLCDGDGPIGEFRRWCLQFYPEAPAAPL